MIKTSRFIAVYFLIMLTALFLNLHHDISVPTNKPFNEFPVNIKEWRMVSQSLFTERILNVLKPTDYMNRQYAGIDGIPVNLYIGYHGGGKNSGAIHSPKHCLPGGGWYKASEKKASVDIGDRKINLVAAVYQKGERKDLFLYWYQVKGKTLSDEYFLKFSEIMNSILYKRRDSAFIRVSIPFEADEGMAYSLGLRFIKDFYPVIGSFLPE